MLRRDNVEHLLLIGGPNDVVIETNIVRVAGARIPAPSNDTGAERFEPTLDQPPRAPQVESNGRPSIESQLAAQLGSFVRRPSEESDIDEELSPVAKVSAPIPAHPEPVLKPDAVAVSSAPTIQGLRAEARGPGDQSPSPAPIPVVERPEPRPTFTPPRSSPGRRRCRRHLPSPPMPPEPVRPPQPAAEERPAPSERPAPGAGLLSDMARQLEEALKRPSIPVPPPPAPVAPVASPMAQEETKDEDELPELAGLSSADAEEIAAEETLEEEDRAEETEVAVTAEPAPAPEPVRPASPPPPVSAPLPPQAKEASAAQQKPTDPFSVEDIEAEFARLLGRPLDPGKKG